MSKDIKVDVKTSAPPGLIRKPTRVSIMQLMADPATLPAAAPAPAAGEGEIGTRYHRIMIVPPEGRTSDESILAAKGLRHMLGLRREYLFRPKPPGWKPTHDEKQKWAKVSWKAVDGVYQLYSAADTKTPLVPINSYDRFAHDLLKLWSFVKSGPVKTVCFKRLQVLEKKYSLYQILNSDLEADRSKDDARDFYNTIKVDNHIHIAAAMTSKHLLNFIKNKVKTSPNDVVLKDSKTGATTTLKELFQKLDLLPENLTVESMGVCGGNHMFHRFDQFNNAYSPFGYSDMRTVFSKVNNLQNGKYFAELIREVFNLLSTQESSTYMEPRLSVYGSARSDWDVAANFVVDNALFDPRVAWMVQVPRLLELYIKNKVVKNFQQMLDNFFVPLFEATANPEAHPKLSKFLASVVGFDSVDDEGHYDEVVAHHKRTPEQWTDEDKPPYSYVCYYMYANMYTLNKFREMRGLNTFAFRPHCGEAGQPHHLGTAFLLAENIQHGINLDKSPPLEYLYYLARLGCSISPLSNNTLYRPLKDNPFPAFFARGLNVTLSTDDPMQFHTSAEPLVEEYTIAKQIWQLSSAELGEIANNSVRQSGFSDAWKVAALGDCYARAGVAGNDINKSNVPDCRVAFRYENLLAEYQFVWRSSLEDSKLPIPKFDAKDDPTDWAQLCVAPTHKSDKSAAATTAAAPAAVTKK